MSRHPSMRMEAEQYHQLATGAWPSWNDDSFNEHQWNDNSGIFDDSCITADYFLPLMPDFLDSSHFLLTQTDGSALGSASKFTDSIPQPDPPEFEPASVMDVISPLSSGGTTWTSPSLEFDFNSPVIGTTQPQFGAVPLDRTAQMRDELSSNAPAIAPMDTVQRPPAQPAPEINSWNGVQQQPPLCPASPRLLTMADKPPHISARQWRMEIRPERCRVCGKGHTYPAELKKHMVAQHRHLAAEYGLSTERYVCKWCGKSYARDDHLTRHRTKEHGREKYAKRRRKGERGDGT
ncbi:uncharacterized protein B0H64DRAFT_400831 [Chaetomium fimeti]|jgi:hypothetical protein|uniref:C2H2-type domain-containing protein n=1 Tax=Chaetomium fimeti TaxID=1854472 RepID=A0AAE0LQT9_9PEZI|nr:hypothetical protein B0H64DRAFT_400831 [Chaetomium fimeti]